MSTTCPLPTSRTFVTQLLDSLSATSANTPTSNPNTLSSTYKNHLLALQVLFPNELLPALDLIDRKLITRLKVIPSPSATTTTTNNQPTTTTTTPVPPNSTTTATTPTSNQNSFYHIRSAQVHLRPSRFSHHNYNPPQTSYTVHLTPWSCSCPAFAFAAYPALHPEPEVQTLSVGELDAQLQLWRMGDEKHGNGDGNGDEIEKVEDGSDEKEEAKRWFGGLAIDGDMAVPPVCKHLLACVLVECGVRAGDGDGDEDRDGGVQEKEISVEEAAGWAAGWGD